MAVLGIDYGLRKVGLAKAGPGTPAVPLQVIRYRREPELLDELERVCREEAIERLVVGLPQGLGGFQRLGGGGAQAERVRAFARRLEQRLALPVVLHDERLSSREARRLLRLFGSAAEDDAVAAMLVLQAWLDRQGLSAS